MRREEGKIYYTVTYKNIGNNLREDKQDYVHAYCTSLKCKMKCLFMCRQE